jgi:hypothetical protein
VVAKILENRPKPITRRGARPVLRIGYWTAGARNTICSGAAQPADRDGIFNGSTMTDDQAKHDGKAATPAKDSRQDRLKLALRENLKRRKSQARGRSDLASTSSEDADAALDDADGKAPGRVPSEHGSE